MGKMTLSLEKKESFANWQSSLLSYLLRLYRSTENRRDQPVLRIPAAIPLIVSRAPRRSSPLL